ncbi:MAG TPA: shikimate kinase [Blastocatellia bacterium]|nr:shikimate kinase [Blastocatellia bacterium]
MADHIFLVGFMGAGKSTVGAELARKLSRRFYDLDQLIEQSAGTTVARIFEAAGESEFRRLEQEAVARCDALEPSVIAVGGGAFVSQINREAMQRSGVSVWLNCPLETCLARIRGDAGRPKLGADSAMRELLAKRICFYAKADHVIETGDLDATAVADKIVAILGS